MWIIIIGVFAVWALAKAFAAAPEPGADRPLEALALIEAAERRQPLAVGDVVQIADRLANEIAGRYPDAAMRLREIETVAVPWARKRAARTGEPVGDVFRTCARRYVHEARARCEARARDGCDRLWSLLTLSTIDDGPELDTG